MASQARTEFVTADPLPSAAELRWPDRDIADNLDYTADFTPFLSDAGDTISAVEISSQPADLTITQKAQTQTSITRLIGGGTLTNPLTDYAITVVITTAGGLSIERTFWQRVTKLSPNTSYGTAISVVTGEPGRGISGTSLSGTSLVITYTDATQDNVPVTAFGAAASAAVSSEASRATAAEVALSAGLATETGRAQGAEAALGSSIGSIGTSLSALAGNALQGLSADASALSAGASPTVSYSATGANTGHLSFGIPRGDQGPVGPVQTFVPMFTGKWNPTTGLASNGATLTAAATGLQPGQQFYTSAAGTSSITGTSTTWSQGDVAVVTADGSHIIQIPASVFGGYASILSSGGTPTSPAFQIIESPDGTVSIVVTDGLGHRALRIDGNGLTTGAITATVATIGSLILSGALSAVGGITAPSGTFQATPSTGFQISEQPDGTFRVVLRDNFGNRVFVVDRSGMTLRQINGPADGSPLTVTCPVVFEGNVTAPNLSTGGAGTTTFSQSDLAYYAAQANAFAASWDRQADIWTQKYTADISLIVGAGQSHMSAYQGGLALSQTPSAYDLMCGYSTRPFFLVDSTPSSNDAVYAPTGPLGTSGAGTLTFQPLAAACQANIGDSPIVQPKTGILANLQGVTVSNAGSISTIAWTSGGTASAVFSIGDFCDFEGLPSHNSDGSAQYSVTAAGSLTLSVSPTISVVSSPINGVSIAQVNNQLYGEDILVGLVTQLRAMIGPAPTKLLPVNLAVSGTSIEQDTPGASPNYGARIADAFTKIKAYALSKGYATVACPAVVFAGMGNNLDGGSGPNAGENIATLMGAIGAFDQSVIGSAQTILGQSLPPALFLIPPPTIGRASNDFSADGQDRMPVFEAMARYAGLAPDLGSAAGQGQPVRKGVYIPLAMSGQVPDRSPHYFPNGYRAVGNKGGAKVFAVASGGTCKPLIITGAYGKQGGTQVLVTFYVPSGRLQFQQAWFHTSLLTQFQQGFAATDDTLPIPGAGTCIAFASAPQLVGGLSEMLITLGTKPLDFSKNPYLWHGDSGLNLGRVTLCDSDPIESVDVYSYSPGSGQAQIEGTFASPGSHYPMQNYCLPRCVKIQQDNSV
jgi:hypothetical protein